MKKFNFLVLGLMFSVFSLQAADSVPAFLKNFPTESFHKLVSGNQVIGKTLFHWKPENGYLFFKEDSEMQLTLFKKPQIITTSIGVWTNDKMEIQKFNFTMKSLESTIEISAERQGNILKMRVTQAGKVQTKDVAIQEPVLMSPTIRPFLLMRGLPAEKAKFEAYVLEPAALTTVPLSLELTKKSKDLWTLKVSYLQHDLISEINSVGSLIKEKSDFAGLPVEAVAVSKSEMSSMKVVGTKADLVELSKVSFPSLPKARELKSFSVKISGVDLKNYELNRHRQKLDRDILTVQVENPAIESAPAQSLVGKKEFEKYLEGDTSIPVYDPVIQKKAREIIGNESDLWKRAKLIYDFVFKTLEKTPFTAVPNAIEALTSKKGDCKEHAALYTALARAAGIPTRTVVGLVYSDHFYGEPGFYYHAWVEVYTGKNWVAIDPTWNQIPADSTHLAFVEGGLDQQVQVTALMGKVKLSPVDATRPKL
ncbi:MAG: transglutaminase domain-containing protein [Deltaproteobacteria bacterium]|nr:transglutaminase domain-containing protein [Deltaproteobacteria bacterium]